MRRVVLPATEPAGRAIERAVRALGPEWQPVVVRSTSEAEAAMADGATLVDAWSTAESLDLVRAALAAGVPVVSANAAALEHAAAELQVLAESAGTTLLTDAAVGGSRVARVEQDMAETEGVACIQGCLDPVAELLVAGIAAGNTVEEATAHAHVAGLGRDAVHLASTGERAADALAVLAGRAFERAPRRSDVAVLGVDWLQADDAARVREEGRRWRLVATATSACARVEPVPLAAGHPLAEPGCRLEVRGNAGSAVRLLLDVAPRAVAAAVAADLVVLEEESRTRVRDSSIRSVRGYSVA